MREAPYVCYGDDNAVFERVCPQCGKFVKADDTIQFGGKFEHQPLPPTATCSQHGRVDMPFVGYIE